MPKEVGSSRQIPFFLLSLMADLYHSAAAGSLLGGNGAAGVGGVGWQEVPSSLPGGKPVVLSQKPSLERGSVRSRGER